ncbi:MAG TPA: glycerol-3-phosphate 1-O-acyltransferase PlsY [Gammaproteobacteria bacterium]|jgi:glycerol-3-phosphate acyltransferase PlsY|nr:glycerol-3-phosphate 1-O-acyltransferase PlsY [Gammaproteobacteria bacterium]
MTPLAILSTTVVSFLFAYFIGSFSSAIIVCQVMRLPDPRTHGSSNPGATNVLRIGGKKAAFFTLAGDMLKGFLPVLFVQLIGLPQIAVLLTALGAFLGHLFPIFFHFKGGKGVATAIGCMFALNLPAGVCWVITWVMIVLLSQYVSLASLIATSLAPFYFWLFQAGSGAITVISIMSLLLIYRHRSNIVKLMQGKESKITHKVRD